MSSDISTEVVRAATGRDLLASLAALDPLPRRASTNPELEFATFKTALEGRQVGQIVVAYVDLMAAVRAIVQGALGHAYHPSPAELRMQCDAKRDERLAEIATAARRRAAEEDQASYRSTSPKTPEARERVASTYAKFCKASAQASLELATKNFHSQPRQALLSPLPADVSLPLRQVGEAAAPITKAVGPPDPKTVCGTAKPGSAPV
ncbi:MAG: hypothetical protein EOS54_11770 [Mesorhizobium sp.]|uniref:hypothetical protein n=1 Tax=Mesorhizobium sp. TaxID=1871066 RepID=UPI000FE4E045|nr:hypothetical protein [Mesorhizobium sp.]RWC53852.1 MAG: hypothetical protein EOS54_11770 [Mesorhizobium sp.]TIV83162.1 MAG: hypothetical protein E5V64_09235 [Mesorhizobium sp.]TIW47684.1 MAG: hypothetical protein E5V61_07480 [Mesorhizobium sp.]TIX16666.1 MAG: hypothetical protein E5V46_01835 [Mesorhizobium sp.]TIX68440.1 MAG: hypothetical protein E5V30_21295 [Mesorhizobium sp.]